MADQHDLIAAVKRLAAELGRTPTRREFASNVPGGEYNITRLFGGYTPLVHAAGLEPNTNANRNKAALTNEIFQTDVADRLEKYEPRESTQKTKFTPTLCIGDTHFPFASQRVLDAIYEWALKYQPSRIVQIGDLFDSYAHSKFPRSHNVYIPKEEETLARSQAEKMWQALKDICPQAECVQLKGNHDTRMLRQTLANLPTLEHVVSRYLDELMTFPGVKLISDERQEYIVDDVMFIHGYGSRHGQHRDYVLTNAVVGHTHLGGVTYRRIRGQTLFELNCGLVGDPESKALSYTPQKITNWTPGFGFIDERGPRFIAV